MTKAAERERGKALLERLRKHANDVQNSEELTPQNRQLISFAVARLMQDIQNDIRPSSRLRLRELRERIDDYHKYVR